MSSSYFPSVDKLRPLIEKLCKDEVIQNECTEEERNKIIAWADIVAGQEMNEFIIMKVLRSHASLDDYTKGTLQIAKMMYMSIARKLMKSN